MTSDEGDGNVSEEEPGEPDVDWLTRELYGVIAELRSALENPKAIFLPSPDRVRDAYVLGGLAHCCLALEELNGLRLRGDDLLAYLVGRSCLETWLTTTWLFLKGEEGEKALMGNYARHLRAQRNKILSDFEKAQQERRKIRKSRQRLARTNRNIQRGNERNGSSMALRELPRLPPTPDPPDITRLDEHLSGLTDVPSESIPFEMMADQLGPLAERAGIGGGNWSNLYNVVYRSLSTWGAHPSIWLFNQYLDPSLTHMVHVMPVVASERRAEMVTLGTFHLVVMLAAEVFAKLEIDESRMREADAWCRGLEAYLRAEEGS